MSNIQVGSHPRVTLSLHTYKTQSKKQLLTQKGRKLKKLFSGLSLAERKPFRFLDLPAELRNLIYVFALVDQEPICFEYSFWHHSSSRIVCVSFQHSDSSNHDASFDSFQAGADQRVAAFTWCLWPVDSQSCRNIALLQTCKQINNEAASIFYGENKFAVFGQDALPGFLSHFRAHISLVLREAVYLSSFSAPAITKTCIFSSELCKSLSTWSTCTSIGHSMSSMPMISKR